MEHQPKKMLILAILEILKQGTDETHRLRQMDIVAQLQEHYGLSATRKAVRRNLQSLQDAGYPVYYRNGWYYEHELYDTEMAILIDSLNANICLPASTRQTLAAKLTGLYSRYNTVPREEDGILPVDPSFSVNYELLREAIRRSQAVVFSMMYYDVDKMRHPRLNPDGTVKRYQVSPYAIRMQNGYYYLVGNVSTHDGLCHFRLDHVADVQITDLPIRPLKETGTADDPSDEDYTACHYRMYSGTVCPHRIRAERALAACVIETFGLSVVFENVTDDWMEVIIRTDDMSLSRWLLQFPGRAEPLA